MRDMGQRKTRFLGEDLPRGGIRKLNTNGKARRKCARKEMLRGVFVFLLAPGEERRQKKREDRRKGKTEEEEEKGRQQILFSVYFLF